MASIAHDRLLIPDRLFNHWLGLVSAPAFKLLAYLVYHTDGIRFYSIRISLKHAALYTGLSLEVLPPLLTELQHLGAIDAHTCYPQAPDVADVCLPLLDYPPTVYPLPLTPTNERKRQRAIWRRDGNVCQYCGTPTAPAYHVDHVIPQSRAGVTRPFNLVVACEACNLRKNDAVWVPTNLDLITEGYPKHRARVLELAVPRA